MIGLAIFLYMCLPFFFWVWSIGGFIYILIRFVVFSSNAKLKFKSFLLPSLVWYLSVGFLSILLYIVSSFYVSL